jgi:hypothetical protein
MKIRELSAAVPPPNNLSPDELAAGGPIDDILMVCTPSHLLQPVLGSMFVTSCACPSDRWRLHSVAPV